MHHVSLFKYILSLSIIKYHASHASSIIGSVFSLDACLLQFSIFRSICIYLLIFLFNMLNSIIVFFRIFRD